jgi:hypothetical protein
MPKGYELRTKPTVEDGIAFIDTDSTKGGRQVVEYQPGNGTRYVLVITKVTNRGSVDSEARDILGTGDATDTYLVTRLRGDQGHSMLVGGIEHSIHYKAVQTKLGCGLMSDAVVVAELIGYLLNMPHVSCEEFEAQKGV